MQFLSKQANKKRARRWRLAVSAVAMAAATHLALAHAATEEGLPLSAAERAEFFGDNFSGSLFWTKYKGSDFILYHGDANRPLNGGIGLYLGDSPPPIEPHPGAKIVQQQVGLFAITWQRVLSDGGEVEQEAIVALDEHRKAHIWVESKSEPELEKLVAELARLALFAPKMPARQYSGPGFVDPTMSRPTDH